MANAERGASRAHGDWRQPVTVRPRGPVRAAVLSLVTVSLYGFWWWWDVGRQLRALGEPADPGRALAAVTVGFLAVVPPFQSVHRTTAMIAAAQRRAGVTPTPGPSATVAIAALAAPGAIVWAATSTGRAFGGVSSRCDLAAARDGVRRLRAAAAEPGHRSVGTGGTVRGRRCRFRV